MNLLRTNPGLLVMVMLVGIASLVLTIITIMMARSGQSLRPIVWFAGFFGIIVVPQFAYHLGIAMHWLQEIPAWTPKSDRAKDAASPGKQPDVDRTFVATVDENALALRDGRFASPAQVFGGDFDPQLVQDARVVFGNTFEKARAAQFAVFPTGESALAAAFPSAADAREARDRYLRFFNADPRALGDAMLVTFPHPSGNNFVRVVTAGPALFVWTAPDGAALTRRAEMIGALTFSSRAVAQETAIETPVESKPSARGYRIPGAWAAVGVAVLLVVAVLWFFKGSTWAASAPASPGVERSSLADLRRRLIALNELDVPFHVSESSEPGAIEVTWRYADAKWIDLARLRGMRRTHRYVLRFDEAANTVRVREFWGAYDWSVGKGGASIQWHAATGITFFERRHETVLGLQLDERGRLKPELSYTYTFDVDEMRSPVRAIVTTSGWNWRQLTWDAPGPLRWLTE